MPRLALPTAAVALAAAGGWALSAGLALSGTIPLPAGVLLDALFAYLGWTAMHEAAHGNTGSRALDEAIGWICSALLYAPFASWRSLHLRHHAHTNDPRLDPDHWVDGKSALSIALRCLTILPRYYAEFVTAPRRLPLRATLGPQLVFLGIFAFAAAQHRLLAVLALWPLAAVLASAALAFLLDWMPHHGGRIANVDLPGFSWLTLGHGDHAAHHAAPEVPFWRYRVLRYAITASRSASESPSPKVCPALE